MQILAERLVECTESGSVSDETVAQVIRVVLDQLNTLKPASLYEAYERAKARWILRRLEFHHALRHAICFNQTEIKSSALSEQGLDKRLPDEETLSKQ